MRWSVGRAELSEKCVVNFIPETSIEVEGNCVKSLWFLLWCKLINVWKWLNDASWMFWVWHWWTRSDWIARCGYYFGKVEWIKERVANFAAEEFKKMGLFASMKKKSTWTLRSLESENAWNETVKRIANVTSETVKQLSWLVMHWEWGG